ncbi:MAG: GyrI-like domain-containing protein [Thermoleophilia bacterium]|nr:GyrI-like domain-containing protein [Thermoleophilia bacterium]
MVKLDLKKQLKHLYMPSATEVAEIDVPEMQFAMIDGRIEPGVSPGDSPDLVGCIGALFAVSYTLKFVSKKRPEDPIDYTVMALEGLWTTPEGGSDYATSDDWSFTLMIMQPDHIAPEMFDEALEHLKKKRAKDGHPTATLERLRLERFVEGRCVQIMHLGPYMDEPRSLEKMGANAAARGYTFVGRHHEIYIGDPLKAKPENLKTVLRHAVVPVA